MNAEYKDGKVILNQKIARDIKIAIKAYYASIQHSNYTKGSCERLTAQYIEENYFLESRNKRIPQNELPIFLKAVMAKVEELAPNL